MIVDQPPFRLGKIGHARPRPAGATCAAELLSRGGVLTVRALLRPHLPC